MTTTPIRQLRIECKMFAAGSFGLFPRRPRKPGSGNPVMTVWSVMTENGTVIGRFRTRAEARECAALHR